MPARCPLPNPLAPQPQTALSCPARSCKHRGARGRASLQSTTCFVTVLCRSSTPHCADEHPGCPRLLGHCDIVLDEQSHCWDNTEVWDGIQNASPGRSSHVRLSELLACNFFLNHLLCCQRQAVDAGERGGAFWLSKRRHEQSDQGSHNLT